MCDMNSRLIAVAHVVVSHSTPQKNAFIQYNNISPNHLLRVAYCTLDTLQQQQQKHSTTNAIHCQTYRLSAIHYTAYESLGCGIEITTGRGIETDAKVKI